MSDINKGTKISFSVQSIEIIDSKEVNDDQFLLARVTAFGSGKTKHQYTFTDDVIKDAEFSILGKPVLYYYDWLYDDASGHEEEEVPAGFVPLENANITYEQTDKGLMMTVDCYIWKMYSGKLCEILQRENGIKDVSVELLILDSIDHDETKTTEVLKFVYTGITILGEHVNPAKPGSHLEVVKFSELESSYNDAKQSFEKKLYNSLNQGSQASGSFFNTKNKTEVAMELEKNVNSEAQLVENAEKVTTTTQKVGVESYVYDDNGNFVGRQSESHKKETTEVQSVDESVVANADCQNEKCAEDTPETCENACKSQNACKTENACGTQDNACKSQNACGTEDNACKSENSEDVSCAEQTDCACKTQDNACKSENACKTDNACGTQDNACKSENACGTQDNACKTQNACKQNNSTDERLVELRAKFSALENEVSTLRKEKETLELKCSELEAYKSNKENELKKQAVECALSKVSNVLSADQIDEWREKSVGFAKVDDFTNQLKAFAFDIQSKNGTIENESIRNSLPKQTFQESDDVWERIANY